MTARAEMESAVFELPSGTGADEELSAELSDGRAGAAVWWRRTPPFAGHRVGLVGRYRADTEAAGAAVLSQACRILSGRGCTLAIGPMDGSTWDRYRLVTATGPPPFFLEPDNPPEWPRHFVAAGFRPFATYHSAMTPPLERLALPPERPRGGDIGLRPLDLSDYECEMRRIHALSLECFRANLLFTPLDWQEFAARYRPLRPHLREGLSWVAESGGEPVGFVLGVPDMLQADVDTVILKTLATRARLRGRGIGHALAAQCLREARRRSYRHAVFALIRDGNPSERIVARYAKPIRTYALYLKELGHA